MSPIYAPPTFAICMARIACNFFNIALAMSVLLVVIVFL
jgi:hypothetical protein